jgi:predicted nucleic acid-binding Zn ribbon protein
VQGARLHRGAAAKLAGSRRALSLPTAQFWRAKYERSNGSNNLAQTLPCVEIRSRRGKYIWTRQYLDATSPARA